MRENRPYGSEGGEADASPTPIEAQSHFLAAIATPAITSA
jgi:hypothetical protein